MYGLCGCECNGCEMLVSKKCLGCKESKGCPLGKKCWIYNYIDIGNIDNFNELKKELVKEINSLKIDGMPKIDDLFPLHGSFVNLEYNISNNKIKFLDDNEIYLGNQVECLFNDNDVKRCFGIVCNMNFIIISEYGEDGSNPELILFKKR